MAVDEGTSARRGSISSLNSSLDNSEMTGGETWDCNESSVKGLCEDDSDKDGGASELATLSSVSARALHRLARIPRQKYVRTLSHCEVADRAATYLLALVYQRVDVNTASRQVLNSIQTCVSNDVAAILRAHPPRDTHLTFESALYAACWRMAAMWVPNLSQSPTTARFAGTLGVAVSAACDTTSGKAVGRAIHVPLPIRGGGPTTSVGYSTMSPLLTPFGPSSSSDPTPPPSADPTGGQTAYGVYAAVIEGHNGFDAAEACRTLLHHNLIRSEHFPQNMRQAVVDAYHTTHEHALRRSLFTNTESGATVTTAVVHHGTLTVGNVGDCRCYIYSRETTGATIPELLTTSHVCAQQDEVDAVIARGGFVYEVNGVMKVNGKCEFTRAIGYPPCTLMLSHTPDVVQRAVRVEDDFAVIASEGVWAALSPQEVGGIVRQYLAEREKAALGGMGLGCDASALSKSPPMHGPGRTLTGIVRTGAGGDGTSPQLQHQAAGNAATIIAQKEQTGHVCHPTPPATPPCNPQPRAWPAGAGGTGKDNPVITANQQQQQPSGSCKRHASGVAESGGGPASARSASRHHVLPWNQCPVDWTQASTAACRGDTTSYNGSEYQMSQTDKGGSESQATFMARNGSGVAHTLFSRDTSDERSHLESSTPRQLHVGPTFSMLPHRGSLVTRVAASSFPHRETAQTMQSAYTMDMLSESEVQDDSQQTGRGNLQLNMDLSVSDETASNGKVVEDDSRSGGTRTPTNQSLAAQPGATPVWATHPHMDDRFCSSPVPHAASILDVEASLRALSSAQLPIEVAMIIASQARPDAGQCGGASKAGAGGGCSAFLDIPNITGGLADTDTAVAMGNLTEYELSINGGMSKLGDGMSVSHRAVVCPADAFPPSHSERERDTDNLTSVTTDGLASSMSPFYPTPTAHARMFLGRQRSVATLGMVSHCHGLDVLSDTEESLLGMCGTVAEHPSCADLTDASHAAGGQYPLRPRPREDAPPHAALFAPPARIHAGTGASASPSLAPSTLGGGGYHGGSQAVLGIPADMHHSESMRVAHAGSFRGDLSMCLSIADTRQRPQSVHASERAGGGGVPGNPDASHLDVLAVSAANHSLRVLYNADEDAYSLFSLLDGGADSPTRPGSPQPLIIGTVTERENLSVDPRVGSELASQLDVSPDVSGTLAENASMSELSAFDGDTHTHATHEGRSRVGLGGRRYKSGSIENGNANAKVVGGSNSPVHVGHVVGTESEGEHEIDVSRPAMLPLRQRTSRGSKRRKGSWVSLGASRPGGDANAGNASAGPPAAGSVLSPSAPRKPLTPRGNVGGGLGEALPSSRGEPTGGGGAHSHAPRRYPSSHYAPVAHPGVTSPPADVGEKGAQLSPVRRPTPPVLAHGPHRDPPARERMSPPRDDRIDCDDLSHTGLTEPSGTPRGMVWCAASGGGVITRATPGGAPRAYLTSEAAARHSAELAELIIQQAAARESRDNLSVVVLLFPGQPRGEANGERAGSASPEGSV